MGVWAAVEISETENMPFVVVENPSIATHPHGLTVLGTETAPAEAFS